MGHTIKLLTFILFLLPCLTFAQSDNKEKLIGSWQLYPNVGTGDTLTFVRPTILTEKKINLNPDTHWSIKEGGEMTIENSFSNWHTTDGIIDGKDPKDTIWSETVNGVTTHHAIKAPLKLSGATVSISYWSLSANGDTLIVAKDLFEIIILTKDKLQLIKRETLIKPVQIFGQTNLNGTWKSTNGLARDIYAFDTTGKVTREFSGDLSYYKIQGNYIITSDTIKITYYEPTEEEKKIYFRGGTPQLADTIYIVNDEKLVRKIKDLRIYLYNKIRDVPVFNIDSLGVLNLTVRDFGDKILLMHRRNYVWTVIEVWTNPDSAYLKIKNYQLPMHSGTNEFWILVKNPLRDEYIKQFKVESKKPEVKVKNTKITDTLEFTATTYYTISDIYGKVVLKGTADSVDCTILKPGKYYLNYDNKTTTIKKK